MSMDAHPGFEDLSAHHDGEAPEWATHVAACAACRSQLDELAALSASVAGPIPAAASSAGLDQVARALADADRPAPGGSVAAGEPTGSAAEDRPGRAPAPRPVPLPVRPRSQATAASGPDRARWTRWTTAASAAAVVLLVAGVLALVARDGDGGDTTTALTDQPARESSARQPESVAPDVAGSGPDATVGAVAGGAFFGGDLGEIPDAATLVARAGPGARAGRDRAAASEATAAPPAASGGGRGTAPPGVVGTRPCETPARDRGGELGPVVFYATATRAGVPAVVLGFAPVGGTGPVTVQALAQADCRVLLSASSP